MKFGKLLELRALPEWREQYLSYKKLKRITKMVPAVDASDQGEAGATLLPADLAAASRAEDAFFELLDSDLGRINSHAVNQLASIEKRMTLLQAQLASRVVAASPLATSYRAPRGRVDVAAISEAYSACARLRSFSLLNQEGVRKIVKKLDKRLGQQVRQGEYVKRLDSWPREEAERCMALLENMCTLKQLEAVKADAAEAVSPHTATSATPRLWALALSAVLATCVGFVDLGAAHVHERRCLAMLAGVVALWLTEACPYYVTALLIPAFAVVGKVLPQPLDAAATALDDPLSANGTDYPAARVPDTMPADASARLLLGSMFDRVILLVLAGLTASAVVSRCQLELRLAVVLQRTLGRRPRLLILAIMHLGLVTSMLISNVTAPILLLAVVQPLLRELPSRCRYSKAVVLGLAFACNLGGMLPPISSPQNAGAVEALSRVGVVIDFGTWLCAALPVAEAGTWLAFCLLLLTLRPDDVTALPPIYVDNRTALTWRHVGMLLAVLLTVLLWGTLSLPPLADTFGDAAVVGLGLIAAAFGSGFLLKEDFNGLSWHLLALIGGGNALGLAVSRSGLLDLAAAAIVGHLLAATGVWLLTAELIAALLLITSFVSHTVAAIVTMPLVCSIGLAAGQPAQIVFCCALTCSAAMALPMSSFPNVNSLLAEDDYGRPYLIPSDFVRVGLPTSLLVSALCATVAFALIGVAAVGET